jgi:hypothetical protein
MARQPRLQPSLLPQPGRRATEIKEALAITHALETQILPGIEAAHERRALADEISRIASELRAGRLETEPASGSGALRINKPEQTGITAELMRSADGHKSFAIQFRPWPPSLAERRGEPPMPQSGQAGGQVICKICKRPLP